MRVWRIVFLLALASGCRGSKCKEALAHFGALPHAAQVAEVCVDDAWTDAQIVCIKRAPTWPELDYCSLSDAQRAHVAAVMAGPNPTETARATARRYAAAYPAWHADHPRDPCPPILLALQPYTPIDPKDPWGHDYDLRCGADLPPAVTSGIAIVSNGPDGVAGTADDLHSWE